ncbi:MAG: protein kinase domain-containing protein [Planctomycetota bacterium]|jgi:hypothetical protein
MSGEPSSHEPIDVTPLEIALQHIEAGADVEDALDGLDEGAATEVRSLLAMRAVVDREGFMADAASLPPALPLPQRIGRYQIERVLGSGASGTVYRAMQDDPHRAVALKILDRTLARPDARRRFAHEAAVLAALDHRGIARVLEAGTHEGPATPPGGLPYIAMELVQEALPITDYARANDLDDSERVDLMIAACDAVGHGHARRIVHRDIKPGNLLVDAEGNVKVIDLGVARVLGDDHFLASMHTAAGQLLGTVRYMSPEQADGATDRVDARSDVYALGIVLYELLCDRLPYDPGTTSMSRAVSVIYDTPPTRPRSLRPALPRELENVLLTALEKNPLQRYADATELGNDLRLQAAGKPLARAAEGTRERLAHRRILVTGLAALATTLVALAAMTQTGEPGGAPAAIGARRVGSGPSRLGPLIYDQTTQSLVMFECIPPDRASLLPWRLHPGKTARWTRDPRQLPTARVAAAIASSAAPPRLILFGGTTHNAVSDILSIYDGSGALVQPTGASAPVGAWPPPRERASMAHDSLRDRFVVFGGEFSERNRNHVVLADTWVLTWSDGAAITWRRVGGSEPGRAGPPPRRNAAFVYDPGTDAFVLHGGDTGADALDDTWILEAASDTWRRVSSGGPKASGTNIAAYDAVHGVVLVDTRGDLWGFADDRWQPLAADAIEWKCESIVATPGAGLVGVGRTPNGVEGRAVLRGGP